MGRSWLPALSLLGIGVSVGIATVTAGCTGRVADRPAGAPSVTTQQLFKSNPQFHQQVMSQLEYQIQHSNLSPDEKQRQIQQLRSQGPPP